MFDILRGFKVDDFLRKSLTKEVDGSLSTQKKNAWESEFFQATMGTL